jgi:hypothetical protein
MSSIEKSNDEATQKSNDCDSCDLSLFETNIDSERKLGK